MSTSKATSTPKSVNGSIAPSIRSFEAAYTLLESGLFRRLGRYGYGIKCCLPHNGLRQTRGGPIHRVNFPRAA